MYALSIDRCLRAISHYDLGNFLCHAETSKCCCSFYEAWHVSHHYDLIFFIDWHILIYESKC